MAPFIDVIGASGAAYRFTPVEDPNSLPAIAGNFVYVQGEGSALTVICSGTGETLLRAADDFPSAQSQGADAIYVRRNVAWRTRSQEHADIVQRHHPVMVITAGLDA